MYSLTQQNLLRRPLRSLSLSLSSPLLPYHTIHLSSSTLLLILTLFYRHDVFSSPLFLTLTSPFRPRPLSPHHLTRTRTSQPHFPPLPSLASREYFPHPSFSAHVCRNLEQEHTSCVLKIPQLEKYNLISHVLTEFSQLPYSESSTCPSVPELQASRS